MSTETATESRTYDFQAEVRQLLDLVIHNLYSDKEVFLRELISNASDALDRARVTRLSSEDARAADGEAGILIAVDADAGTITISDNGVGLTAEQAKEHLGTIARSGTKAFAQAMEDGANHNLIGQFGVGFYSALMIAEKVEVRSLSMDPAAEAIVWTCDGTTSYSLGDGERTTPGTDVVLYVRESDKDFLDADRLRGIVKKHSEFVGYPIRMGEDQINEPRALWTRPPSDISDDEYKAFYKHVSHDWNDPALWVHTQADAPLQYRAVLFIPESKPFDLDWTDGKRPLKLYARRILILDEARELLPQYLRFVRGVVDSEDIHLNVSREMVQKTPVVEKIRKQLTGGLLKRLKRLAKNEPAAYARLWSNFGSTLKEGVHGDSENRARLLPLLRFNATRHDDAEGMISLAEYVEAMPEDQEAIWYLSGPDRDTCARSPHLEAFAARGYEVLLLTDSVDEWVVGSVTEFEGKPLKSAARGAPDLDDEGDAAEAPEGLVGWLGELLDDNVKEVRASRRLTSSPSVLVDDEHGISGNMARILQAANQSVPSGQRILEINPGHDLVRAAEALRAKGAPEAEAVGRLLLDQAQLAEGQVQDPGGMADRLRTLSHLVARAAGVEIAPIEEDIVDEATPAIPADVQGDDEVTAVSIEPPPELTSSFNAREFSEPEAIDPEVIEEA